MKRCESLTGLVLLLLLPGQVRAQAGCQTDRAIISAQRGVIFEPASVTSGQWYWKLVDVAWCEPGPGGGKINIFYRVKDANGNYIANQPCISAYPYTYPSLPPNQTTILTKTFPDWGDYPMSGGNWCPSWPQAHGPYSAWVSSQCPANGSSCPPQASYPSDRVWGMGLPCNYHESYYLTWQFSQAPPPPQPLIVLSQAAFSRQVTLGQELSDDSFTIQNGAGGTLNFSVSESVDWLSVSPVSGNASGTDVRTITIDYAAAALTEGIHHATITVTGNASNSPQTVEVTLDAHPPRYLADIDLDGDVDQIDFARFQLCLSGDGVYQLLPACTRARLDGDVDVDGADFNIFRECMRGPEQTPPASCLE